MFDFLGPLFGRMHPLFVHLPIGILVFGILLSLIPQKDKNSFFPAIKLAFLLGGISALIAGISGFVHYLMEGFTWEDVKFHLVGGVFTSVTAFWIYFQLKKEHEISRRTKMSALGLGFLLIFTGHLGGNLTHGSTYFTEILPLELQSFLGIEYTPEKGPQLPEEGWENLGLYSEVVQPILNQNCKNCHNPRNQKGGLDLSSISGIKAGGEDGVILTAGDATHSELFARLILPKEDEKHMPPSGKRQPSKEEIALIETWIQKGGVENQTLTEAEIPRKLIERFILKNQNPFYPVTEIPAIPEDSLASLKSFGFFAESVEQGSGLIKVSCINFPSFRNKDWEKLSSLKNRLAYLDLGGTQVNDSILESLRNSVNLTVLKLNNTSISGKSMELLAQLPNLKILYLNKTEVNLEQIQSLATSKSLEKVFVYETPASAEIPANDKIKFPFLLEVGNYELPKLPTDTIVY
jgi:uncharacterized membrane protein